MLRHWKNHMAVGALLEFAVSAMKHDDSEPALRRMETVHATAYKHESSRGSTV